jgi:DNA-binding SARP family transcriptional activator
VYDVGAAAAPGIAGASADGRTDPGDLDGARVRLNLLDEFELSRAGRRIDLPPSAQRVVAFVALHERPVNRLFVASKLWLESTEERAQASLRTALWRLGPPDSSSVRTTNGHLALAPGVLVDVRELARQARTILRREDGDVGDVTELANTGSLLSGWYDEWVLIERERFHQLRLHALEALCTDLTARGRFAEAADAALSAVASEPLRESAHRVLIRTYIAEGNASAAIRQYAAFRNRLEVELGLSPSRQLEELVRDVWPRARSRSR